MGTLSFTISLDAIGSRMQRNLQRAMNLTAIGLNHTPAAADFSLPDTTMIFQVAANIPWTLETAQTEWNVYVLQNGFREVAEAMHHVFDDVHQVVSIWHLVSSQGPQGTIKGEDWNEIVVRRGRDFHGLGLPRKIRYLKDEYGFEPDLALLEQVQSINRARNCLAHRAGQVTDMDCRGGPHLTVIWTSMMIHVRDGEKESYHLPPLIVEKGASVGIANRPTSKDFPIGSRLLFTAAEFSQICWTLNLFGISLAKDLEAYGRAKGMSFTPPAST